MRAVRSCSAIHQSADPVDRDGAHHQPRVTARAVAVKPFVLPSRYGHPFEREYVPSSVSPDSIVATVRSFLEFGLAGVEPKVRGGFHLCDLCRPAPGKLTSPACATHVQVGWGWRTIHEINGAIDWSKWEVYFAGKGTSTAGADAAIED